jgi:hypothetical protein
MKPLRVLSDEKRRASRLSFFLPGASWCLLAIGVAGAGLDQGAALAGAPIAIFFPSYATYFFAGRYGGLGNIFGGRIVELSGGELCL